MQPLGGSYKLPFPVDLVIHNANIITMDLTCPYAEALATSNARIIAIGKINELTHLFEKAQKLIDANGRTLLPGFIDSHAHLAGLGRRLMYLDFENTTTIEQALKLVETQVKKSTRGSLILGYNWDESKWDSKRFLTKADLDPIAPENPIILTRVCGHLISVNSLVLNKLKVDTNDPCFDLDEKTAEPTGVLRDFPIDIKAFGADVDNLSKSIIEACKYANSVGITSLHENLSIRQLSYLEEYIKLAEQGHLTVRIYANLEPDMLDQLARLRLPSHQMDNYFRLGGLKVFIDGSLGAQTAALSSPYNDKPESKGLLLFSQADYRFLVATANELGLQVSTHAIGDRAIDLVLRVHEKESKAALVKKLRHNIIHAELLTVPLIKRAKQLDLLLLQQPNFAHRWGRPKGMYETRLGPTRAQQLNNFRRILDAGIKVAFGSDCMPMDPLYGIYSAVTHPNPDIRISIQEAIRLYTLDAAYASFEEKEKGSLAIGKLADFIVLSENPFEIEPKRLRQVNVLETYLGGKCVYSCI